MGVGQLAQRGLSSEKALNRLNASLVSEIKRGIAISFLYAIGGKSCVSLQPEPAEPAVDFKRSSKPVSS